MEIEMLEKNEGKYFRRRNKEEKVGKWWRGNMKRVKEEMLLKRRSWQTSVYFSEFLGINGHKALDDTSAKLTMRN